ncbi:MAG: hypothetical protein H6974_04340 [Gammaproteobacteria bacterium]|nr:hypothetical protein [Gammaproteobacteria bacterium]
MWQDGLALLIVVIATLAVLRGVLPSRLFRLGARRGGENPVEGASSTGGCSGCISKSSCAKVQIGIDPVRIQRRKSFSSSNP